MFDVSTGANVRSLRYAQNITQAELASRLGVSVNTVVRIENSPTTHAKYAARLQAALANTIVEDIPLLVPAPLPSDALPADTALTLYTRIAADTAALYQMAKGAMPTTAGTARSQRLTPDEMVQRRLDIRDAQKRASKERHLEKIREWNQGQIDEVLALSRDWSVRQHTDRAGIIRDIYDMRGADNWLDNLRRMDFVSFYENYRYPATPDNPLCHSIFSEKGVTPTQGGPAPMPVPPLAMPPIDISDD